MLPLTKEHWQAVSPYLEQAIDLPPDQRGAWLDQLRLTNPALAEDVQGLLAEHEELNSKGFLEQEPDRPTSPAALSSLAGQTVGAYTLESPIGQGGMGSVWLARRSDGRFEGQAAVKLLNAALVGRAGEERFRREGSILARLTPSAHRPSDRRRRVADGPALPRPRVRRRAAASTATATTASSASRRGSGCSSTCSTRSRTRTPT